MPPARRGPHKYKRAGKRGFYAYLDRDTKNISLRTEDEQQADINLLQLVSERAIEGPAPKKGELGALFVECARRARVNHTRKYAYDLNLRLNHILGWLEKQQVNAPSRVTLGLVEAYKESERTRGIADRTINRYLDVWKKAMKLAVEESVATPRALTAFRKLKEPQHQPHQRGLTMEEIDGFLCACEDERDYWLFRTVVGSGLRDDEGRHLVDDGVGESTITIAPLHPGTCECHPRGWTTKNYRYRVIPVSYETAEAARRYVEIKHSMNLDGKDIWERIQRARVKSQAGWKEDDKWKWSMHELRRAWGSHLLAAGKKLANISRWYGHGDIKTTMRYLRVVEDELPDPDSLPI